MTEDNMEMRCQQLLQMATSQFEVSRAIHAAITLGIADKFKDTALSCTQLAASFNVIESGLEDRLCRLLRVLASVGIFEETSAGCFKATALSQLMQKNNPNTVYDAIWSYAEVFYQAWLDLPEAILTGESVFEKRVGYSHWEFLKKNPQSSYHFHKYMEQRSTIEIGTILKVCDFTEVDGLLDVGGGYGQLVRAIKHERHPNLAIAIFDLPEVIQSINKDKDDCIGIQGNFFTDKIPQGYDGIIMRRILHDWPDNKCIEILKNCYQALPEDGYLYIVEAVIQAGSNNQATEAKCLDLHMMLMYRARERTWDQFELLLQQSGFKLEKCIQTESYMSLLRARKVSL